MSENTSQNTPKFYNISTDPSPNSSNPPEEKASEILRYNSYIYDQDPKYRKQLHDDVRTKKILYIDRPCHTLYITGDIITRRIFCMEDVVIKNRPGIFRDMSPPYGWVTEPEGEDNPVPVQTTPETTSSQNS